MNAVKYFQFIIILCLISFSLNGQTENLKVPKEGKLYKEIVKNNDISLCNLYLNNYPEGKRKTEVKDIKEKQRFIHAFTIAAEDYSDTALQNYLSEYPNGQYKTKAIDAIEVAVWQKAHNDNTVDAYKGYLEKYPEGKAAKIATERLEAMK